MGVAKYQDIPGSGRIRVTTNQDVSRAIEKRRQTVERSLDYFNFHGHAYPYGINFTNPGKPVEEVSPTFAGFAALAYQHSPIVFALMLARASLFSEARFQWREFNKGRPGQLFGDVTLAPLENPWPNAKTGDLLVRLMQDYDLTGNFYGWRNGDEILRMRPDWVSIVLGSQMDVDKVSAAIDARPVAYIYEPGGPAGSDEPIVLFPEDVCHFTGPTPDPTARYLGMSWLTSAIQEIRADEAMTDHRQKFFEQGATPNLAITLDVADPERFGKWRDKIGVQFEGLENAYKTLFLGAGATITPVGTDIRQLDFKVTQGGGESRIAAAAGVPPVIVGFSEGLEAATYSNYQLAMRRFADLTMRPLWRMASACFESILEKPSPRAELWYDDRDIPALKDDLKIRAESQATEATSIRALLDAGYIPESVTEAVIAQDWTRLEHTGLFSVQLQPPGTVAPEPTAPELNGNGDQPELPPGERTAVDELINELERRA